MQNYRFIGGMVLIAISAAMFFLGYGNTVSRSSIAVIGIVLIAVSRRKMREGKKNNKA